MQKEKCRQEKLFSSLYNFWLILLASFHGIVTSPPMESRLWGGASNSANMAACDAVADDAIHMHPPSHLLHINSTSFPLFIFFLLYTSQSLICIYCLSFFKNINSLLFIYFIFLNFFIIHLCQFTWTVFNIYIYIYCTD